MRFGVISDIHGNYPALVKVMAELEAHNIQKVYSLGDVAGYYCMLNECIALLKEKAVLNIMGNHDAYLLYQSTCSRSNTVNECINFQRKILLDEHKAWLAQSLATLQLDDIQMTHGGWIEGIEEYLNQPTDTYFQDLKGQYFFSGHTHRQVLLKFGEKLYCNPGSVGQPRDGNTQAGFAIFDHGQISLHRVAYDIDWIAGAMEKAGFDAYVYQNLYRGLQIGA